MKHVFLLSARLDVCADVCALLGAVIQLASTSDIFENSSMTRNLCATVLLAWSLEREVVVYIMFDESQSSTYSRNSNHVGNVLAFK